MASRAVALLALALIAGCADLDALAFNPVHCSAVGRDTCEAVDSPWDRVCTPCGTDYDWGRDYPWMPGTLGEGEAIRGIDPATVEAVRIQTTDGRAELDAYLIPSHGGDPALAQTTILYNHGNYAGIEHYLPRVRMLHEAGYAVLVWDYRGYGKSSQGTTTPTELMADARQVRDRAAGMVVDPKRIVLYGYSLGGLAAVEQAVHEPGCALVTEAGFTSSGDIVTSNAALGLPETFLSAGWFDNVSKIVAYEGPLLAMVGALDQKFTPDDTRRFAAASAGQTEVWVLPGVKHGIADRGVPEAGWSAYAARIRGFLERDAPGCLGP